MILMGLRRQRISQADAEAFVKFLPALSIASRDGDLVRVASLEGIAFYQP